MSDPPRIATCLFDLDGTLIDSIDLIMASFRHTMRTHLGSVPDEARWRAGFGTPLRSQLQAFAGDDEQAARMVATYRAYTDVHHDRLLRSYAGIDRGLAALSRAGVRLAVVTSKTHALARRGLTRCGLNHYFDVLVGFDDVAEHKPHPAPVLAALERLGVDADGALFVGDSPHDIRAGRAAGVRTAAVLWGPFPEQTLARESPHHWLAEPERIGDIAPCRRPPAPVVGYHVAMESTPTASPTLPPGYRTYAYEDPFEDLVGPIGYRVTGEGISFAFQSDQRHGNTGGTLHGGMLMTFADYVLCLTAVWDQPGEKCVTVSCNCEFVASGRPGDVVEAAGEVTRRTRSLTFVRGQLTAGDRLLLTFSAIVKRLPGDRTNAPTA